MINKTALTKVLTLQQSHWSLRSEIQAQSATGTDLATAPPDNIVTPLFPKTLCIVHFLGTLVLELLDLPGSTSTNQQSQNAKWLI